VLEQLVRPCVEQAEAALVVPDRPGNPLFFQVLADDLVPVDTLVIVAVAPVYAELAAEYTSLSLVAERHGDVDQLP